MQVWDLTFKQLGDSIWRIEIDVNFNIILRAVHFILFGVFVWGVLRYRSCKMRFKGDVNEPPTLPVSLTDACLIVLNLVFALQLVMDMGYLFSGVTLPDGMSYAEYAHRGFYPLWVASMLAGGFMLLAWSDDPVKFSPSRRRNILLFIWMAQNVLLLFSAIYRMHLYVCAYSLTRLRIAALVGMVLVLVGLCGIAVRVIRRKSIGWLLSMNGCAILIVLLVLSLSNLSSRIAWFNVKHCQKSVDGGIYLDVGYLTKLGPDALPALIHFVQSNSGTANVYVARRSVARLSKKFEASSENWRSWTVSRHRIEHQLATLTAPVAKRPFDFNRHKYCNNGIALVAMK